jgi:hypothetical protein
MVIAIAGVLDEPACSPHPSRRPCCHHSPTSLVAVRTAAAAARFACTSIATAPACAATTSTASAPVVTSGSNAVARSSRRRLDALYPRAERRHRYGAHFRRADGSLSQSRTGSPEQRATVTAALMPVGRFFVPAVSAHTCGPHRLGRPVASGGRPQVWVLPKESIGGAESNGGPADSESRRVIPRGRYWTLTGHPIPMRGERPTTDHNCRKDCAILVRRVGRCGEL